MLGPKSPLILQSVSQVADGLGGFTDTWNAVTTIQGVLTRGKGIEKWANSKISEVATHVFFCDYNSSISITEKHRFVLGTRTFNILFVYNPGNMNHHLEVHLQEIM